MSQHERQFLLDDTAANVFSVRCILDGDEAQTGNVRQLDEAMMNLQKLGASVPDYTDPAGSKPIPVKKARRK